MKGYRFLTTLTNKIKILAELWLDYRDHDELEDFINYNDVGLPLAYFIDAEIVSLTPKAEVYMDETFHLLITALEVEDTGFETLTDILELSSTN